MMEGCYVVMITASNEEEAVRLARLLVERGLAACVNIVPKVRSIYRWKGEVCDEAEAWMIAKTAAARLEELIAAVRDAHSYETPEIIALPVVGGLPAYLAWVAENTEELS